MQKALTQNKSLLFIGFVSLLFNIVAMPVSAAGNLQVSGWIPYWTGTVGAKDAEGHLDVLNEIHPFGFSIKSDGSLYDLIGLDNSDWQQLIVSARSKNILVTPTVTASDGSRMQKILSDPQNRAKHVQAIVDMVHRGAFDGVNIDYEAKLAETKDFFSIFLKELKAALGTKRLSCTIEPRTPPDSLNKKLSTTMQYANDHAAIGASCDVVEIMAYDQGRIDIKLNAVRRGAPYAPVADIDWVRKVTLLALKSIPKEKIVLGIPTYGHEYEVTVLPQWYQGYRRIRSINPDIATTLAANILGSPTRNGAGEMSFTYATSTIATQLAPYPAPKNTLSGNIVAAQALAYANKTGKSIVFNIVSWSDAQTVQKKVDFARELGLRGVALFKIDGGEDSALWNIFK